MSFRRLCPTAGAGALSCVVLIAAPASADSTTCAGAVLVVPDGSLHTGSLPAGPVRRWYRFVAKAGRSYALMLENLEPGDEQTAATIAMVAVHDGCGSDGSGGAFLPTSEFSDIQEPASMDNFAVGAGRVALRVGSDVSAFFSVGHINDSSSPIRFRVRVEETTLYNPYWTTASGLQSSFHLYNTTNRPCSVTLDLRTTGNATPAGSAGAVTFTLNANTSAERHTGLFDLHIASGQMGHATIAHDCTPGAVLVDAFASNAFGTRLLPLKVTGARQQR
jgi:hypothetical protein